MRVSYLKAVRSVHFQEEGHDIDYDAKWAVHWSLSQWSVFDDKAHLSWYERERDHMALDRGM